MRYLLILTVGVCLLVASVAATADQAEDEAAIRELMKQVYAAANKHDVNAYTALCVEDFESWDGSVKGRVAWGKLVSESWELQKSIQWRLLDEIGIIFVTPDVAIYKARDEETGLLDANGKPLPPQELLRARVVAKRDGKWLYVSMFDRPIEE